MHMQLNYFKALGLTVNGEYLRYRMALNGTHFEAGVIVMCRRWYFLALIIKLLAENQYKTKNRYGTLYINLPPAQHCYMFYQSRV